MNKVLLKKQKSINKIITTTAIVGGAGLLCYLGFKFIRLKKWYDALAVSFKTKIHSVKLTTIVVNCEVKIDNPINQEMVLGKPTVRILDVNSNILAYSNPTNQKINIKKNGTTYVKYMIEVPISNKLLKLTGKATSNVVSYLKNVIAGGSNKLNLGVKLDIVAYMQLPFGLNKEYRDTFTI